MMMSSWSVRLGRCGALPILASIVAVWGPLPGCFEDEGDEFEGRVRCTSGKPPRLEVTLAPGACDYIPRCDGITAYRLAQPEYQVDRDGFTALGRPLSEQLEPPEGSPMSSFLSSSASSGHPDLEIRPGINPRVCVRADASASDGKRLYAWSGVLHSKEGPSESERVPLPDTSFVVEFLITVERGDGEDAGVSEDAGVGPDASTPDAGVGPDTSTPDAGPAPSITNAYVSPVLPPGVDTHFTGVSQYIVAQFSHEGATLDISCALEAGGECGMTLNPTPATGSPPRSEVLLSSLLVEEKYAFTLRAELSGGHSAPYALMAELRPGVGEVACERSTNGLFGGEKMRHLGLRLMTSDGLRVPTADYYLYKRSAFGEGWVQVPASIGGPFLSSPYVHLDLEVSEFDSGRTYLVIAVDTLTDTAVAAREFFWGQPASIPTQGCRICDMSASGYDCEIIPRGN